MGILLYDRIGDLLRRPAVQIVCMLLLCLMAYSNTFHVPFIFDDIHVIVENRRVDSLSAFFSSDYARFRDARWLPLLTIALNRGLGGVDVTGFHVVNLIIHLATVLVLYSLAKATIAMFGDEASRRYEFAPFVASLLFALHPLHTQSVTYIVQRMTSLATLFYLAAIMMYVIAVAKKGESPVRGRLAYAAALVFCLMAMSSKEISFTLPLVLVFYDLCFLKGGARERFLRLVPFFVCLAIMFFQLVGMEKWMYAQAHGGGDAVSRAIPRGTYLVTELAVLVTYLRLLIVPMGQNLDYDYQKFNSLLEPQPALALAVLITLAVAGAYLLNRSFRPACSTPVLCRIAGFACAWFFVTISVESGLVPLIDVIFEHRVYLPSVWLFVAAGMGGCELSHHRPNRKHWVALVTIVLIAAFAWATYRRNHVWRDAISLWTDVTQKSPGRARGWTNLGMQYVNRLDPATAIPLLEHAVNLNPGYYPARYWLGRALMLRGDADRALEHYQVLTELAPDYPKGWEAAGRILLEKNRVIEALNCLAKAQELDPQGFASHGHLMRAMDLVAAPSRGSSDAGR